MLTKNICEYEHAVVKSLKSGASTAEISAHLNGCPDCQETQRVVSFFQSNMKSEPSPKNLPVAGLVRWKSKLREKHRAAERVGQPILIVQTIAALVFTVVFLWLFNTGSLPLATLGEGLSRVAGSMGQIVFPVFIVCISFAIVCLTTVLLLRRFLPER